MEITETTLGPKSYLVLRKSITSDQITDKQMYEDAGTKLGIYMGKNGIKHNDNFSVLYFLWDDENKKADIGIAFEVENIENVFDPQLDLIDIRELKAAKTVMKGSYEKLGEAHAQMMKYVKDNNLITSGFMIKAIEEYVVGLMQDTNPDNLITNIYYFHK